jgi:hypothetical protein
MRSEQDYSGIEHDVTTSTQACGCTDHDPSITSAKCDGDARALRADAASRGFSLIVGKLDALAAAR